MSCGLDICYCQSNSIIYNILYCFNISHVTLYRKYSCQNSRRRWVSIHLMLLFIFFCILFLLSPSWFQYISCYSLSVQGAAEMPWLISFNTSHVTLYREEVVWYGTENCVSIHLMLLFIVLAKPKQYAAWRSFNTSHVTLYHWRGFKRLYRWEVSIHLMLLFIVSMAKQSGIGSRFNTSHVTLYLRHGCIS